MKQDILRFLLCLYHVIQASVIKVQESEVVNVMEAGWEAQDMPDPRYAPEKCGISQSGWFCDPDGVFRNASIGGGPAAADDLNKVLWNAVNESHCPCPQRECFVHNAIIFVAVVGKLKNPKGIPQRNLLKKFAKELQRDYWKADDSECQQEIIVVFSMEDHAIVTEIGDDILKSGMMTYDDVRLVGGLSQDLFASGNLFEHIAFIVSTYKHYLDHPAQLQPTPSSHEVHLQIMTSSSSLNGSTPNAEEVSKLGIIEASTDNGLPSSVIVVVILAVLVFLSIIILILTIPFCKKGDKLCFQKR